MTGLRQPFPCSAFADAGSRGGVNPKHSAHLDISYLAFQGSYKPNLMLGKHDASRLWTAGSKPLRNRFLGVLSARLPPDMAWVHAPVAAIAAGMRGFVQRARGRAVHQGAQVLWRGGRCVVDLYQTTTIRRGKERPFKAVVTSVVSMFGNPPDGGELVVLRVYDAVLAVLLVMAPAKSAGPARAVAAVNRTCTYEFSHLNLFHRFGLARTRCSASTLIGFAISKAIGGVLQA